MGQAISGFSKWNKAEKIAWLYEQFGVNGFEQHALTQYWLSDDKLQQLHDEFSENTLSNFVLPFGLAPNFLINGQYYAIPMVIEESSVVAAAAKAAKYWSTRGGFRTQVLDTEKMGHVHLRFTGNEAALRQLFDQHKSALLSELTPLTQNMNKRGGGIVRLALHTATDKLAHYYQLELVCQTVDSMGANFINSCLEQLARSFKNIWDTAHPEDVHQLEVVMSILSNYVPHCRVVAEVRCPIADLADKKITDPQAFAEKFCYALQIAQQEPYRAVTHNKGIMNGVDAVILATGNDFRAVEAGVHAFAAQSGQYRSLSEAHIDGNDFVFRLTLPLALGTVGGLTALHPMVKASMAILGNPSAPQLMQLAAATGLAQNFAAVRSLITTGIQEGHMKMHLNNILNQHQATAQERAQVYTYFNDQTITHAGVVDYLHQLRQQP